MGDPRHEWSSVVNGLADVLGYYWPAVSGLARVALISGVVLTITAINVRGIRQSAWAVNAFTIGKLVPLAIFIFLGLPHLAERARARRAAGLVEGGGVRAAPDFRVWRLRGRARAGRRGEAIRCAPCRLR